MKDEFERSLIESAPILYGNSSKINTLFYFECPDTWYNILKKLSSNIEFINNFLKTYNVKIVATQVKEKFGELRFYYIVFSEKLSKTDQDTVNEYVNKVDEYITKAEEETIQICANCGDKATKITKGWITHVCDKCFEKENYNKFDE